MAAEQVALIGVRIKEARNALGLSQRELAEKIPGKSDGNQISGWERGEHRPSDHTLEHIARALQRDVSWFMVREPDKTVTPDLSKAATQLDRIEGKLDALLVALRPSTEQQADQLARALAEAGRAVQREREAPAPGKRGPGRRARGAGDAAG